MKEIKILVSLIFRGVARLIKMKGQQGECGGGGALADQDSNWRLSIDPCTKYYVISFGGHKTSDGKLNTGYAPAHFGNMVSNDKSQ